MSRVSAIFAGGGGMSLTNIRWLDYLTGRYPDRTSQADRELLDAARERLDTFDLSAALVIGLAWNKVEGCARPGVRKIGDGGRMHKDTANERVTVLEDAGWLRIEHRPGRGGNRYFLLFPHETMSATGPDNTGQENVRSEPQECPAPAPTMSGRDRTELLGTENQLARTREDQAVGEFLNTISPKLDTATGKKLVAEREKGHPKIGPLAAELARRATSGQTPARLARDVMNNANLNEAETSVVGFTLKILQGLPEPRAQRGAA
jgi:hypothetical protein